MTLKNFPILVVAYLLLDKIHLDNILPVLTLVISLALVLALILAIALALVLAVWAQKTTSDKSED